MQGLFTALVVLVIFAIIVGSVLKQLYNALTGQQNQQAGGRAQAGVPGQQPQQARDTSEPPLEIRQFIEQVRGQRAQPQPQPQQQPDQPAQQPRETQQERERVELEPPKPRTRRTGVMGTSSQPLTSSLGTTTLSSDTTGAARSTVPQARRGGKGARGAVVVRPKSLRQAVIWTEILGKPVAMKRRGSPPHGAGTGHQ